MSERNPCECQCNSIRLVKVEKSKKYPVGYYIPGHGGTKRACKKVGGPVSQGCKAKCREEDRLKRNMMSGMIMNMIGQAVNQGRSPGSNSQASSNNNVRMLANAYGMNIANMKRAKKAAQKDINQAARVIQKKAKNKQKARNKSHYKQAQMIQRAFRQSQKRKKESRAQQRKDKVSDKKMMKNISEYLLELERENNEKKRNEIRKLANAQVVGRGSIALQGRFKPSSSSRKQVVGTRGRATGSSSRFSGRFSGAVNSRHEFMCKAFGCPNPNPRFKPISNFGSNTNFGFDVCQTCSRFNKNKPITKSHKSNQSVSKKKKVFAKKGVGNNEFVVE